MTALRQRLIEDIRLRNFSSHTVEAYVRAVAHLARHYGRSPEQISGEEVRQYLLYLVQERRVSWSLYNQTRCACSSSTASPSDAMSSSRGSPVPGSPNVCRASSHQRNCAGSSRWQREPKYHALLMTLYGAGLRISEAFDLQVGDIDSQRMLIHVQDGKGHKARMAKLSRSIAESWRTLFAARIMGKRPSCVRRRVSAAFTPVVASLNGQANPVPLRTADRQTQSNPHNGDRFSSTESIRRAGHAPGNAWLRRRTPDRLLFGIRQEQLMGILSDFFIADDSPTPQYDCGPQFPAADRCQFKSITPLEAAGILFVLRGSGDRIKMIDEFPSLTPQDAEEWIQRVPVDMTSALAALNDSQLPVVAQAVR